MFEIIYKNIEEKEEYQIIISKVLAKCFREEKLQNSKLSITITLTNAQNIKQISG